CGLGCSPDESVDCKPFDMAYCGSHPKAALAKVRQAQHCNVVVLEVVPKGAPGAADGVATEALAHDHAIYYERRR
ncbi:MAG: hypothetical protein ACKPKO_35835, partial [Candidatus Fonsibacter sp.]